MQTYAFDLAREIKCCFDCPMLFNDWCMLAQHDNFDEKDTIPSWCPLEHIESAYCVDDQCECCDERDACSGALRVVADG